MWLANFKSWKWLVFIIFVVVVEHLNPGMPRQQQILVDTDVDTDDIFALLYLLKLNRLEFNVKAVTINTNGWSNAGHAINHVYDLLFMMGRDDIPVGIGGEGGISQYGALFPNIGGFLPIIQQGMTTAGNCRYRQAIPLGQSGRLDTDTNYGLRKAFLPQGKRRYKPLSQATAQEVMINAISEGPTSVFLMGAHTNFAIFLMSNSQLKKNVKHIYIMGGAVNPAGGESGHVGNLFTASSSNPYAEFNLFADPFAAYQVIHSGIPVTLIPLDATNTIPITKEFFKAFEQNQKTFESQYCFKSLKMARTTFSSDKQFYANYFMWDSFMAGVAVSIMRNGPDNKKGENDFAEMEYMNITVHTSNEPYGVFDGSNPFFTQHYSTPKFHLNNHGVHSGHVQMSLRDPFCLAHNNKLGCKDGYTEEVSGPEGVRVLVAKRAKPNKDPNNILDKEFFSNFLHVLNEPHQSGRLNLTTQFPEYKEVLHKQDLGAKKVVRPVIFDMDMSAGDFLALFYLLKVPIQELNLQAILVTPTGWANAATIDVVYDVLHMMGRDDIQVGLGPVFGMNQSYSFSLVGDCKYVKAIPHGSGGFLDSDTLYGLARDLPRSPRRYMAKNLQPLAVEVWENVTKGSKTRVTILTNGPLTTLAKILDTDKKAFSKIQDVYVVGGHINTNNYTSVGGNLFTVPSNIIAEFNIFLDPLSAKMVIESKLPITLIPWESQQCVTSFDSILEWISQRKKTPEAHFAYALLSKLSMLRKQNHRYQHVDLFLGEILGAVILANGKFLNSTFDVKPTKVLVRGKENIDGQMIVDTSKGTPIKVLKDFDGIAYYGFFADRLGDEMNNNNL